MRRMNNASALVVPNDAPPSLFAAENSRQRNAAALSAASGNEGPTAVASGQCLCW